MIVSAGRVVVVTVVNGRHEHLRRQHVSLSAGDEQPEGVVVVSMGDDRVRDLVQEGPMSARGHVIELPAAERMPLAQARNTGARHAFEELGAELVVFLDVDCLAGTGLAAGYLDAHRRTADRRGVQVLSGPVSYLDPAPPGWYTPAHLAAAAPHPARPAPPPGELVEAEDARLFWSLSFAVSGPAWHCLGGFDEAYSGYGAEDTDLGQRIRAVNGTLWWVGSARAFHQWHQVSDPPVEHLADIVSNANLFSERWGWFPMEDWLEAFSHRGLAEYDCSTARWRVTASTVLTTAAAEAPFFANSRMTRRARGTCGSFPPIRRRK